jgi:hypothetical protein
MCTSYTGTPGRQIEVHAAGVASTPVRTMVKSVAHGLKSLQDPHRVRAEARGAQAHPPKLIEDGMGGSYLLTDARGTPQAILKPCDEEPLAPNNPKVHTYSQRACQGAGRKREGQCQHLFPLVSHPACPLSAEPQLSHSPTPNASMRAHALRATPAARWGSPGSSLCAWARPPCGRWPPTC